MAELTKKEKEDVYNARAAVENIKLIQGAQIAAGPHNKAAPALKAAAEGALSDMMSVSAFSHLVNLLSSDISVQEVYKSTVKAHLVFLQSREQKDPQKTLVQRHVHKKDPVKNPKERKILKKVEKQKIKSDNKLYKTPSEIFSDFSIRNDEQITNAIFDFETRWKNNNQKVGNVFVSNYGDLKKDFEKTLNEIKSPYMKIAKYYNNYATKFGFAELVQNSLNCLIQNTPLSVVKAAYDEAQKEIDDFLKDADTVVTESLNIIDKSIGIAEEVYDTTREIKKEFKDYKVSLKDIDIPTTQDIIRNKLRKLFLDVLLPMITSQIANILNIILDNACGDTTSGDVSSDSPPGSVDISDIIDESSFVNQLKNIYGVGPETLPEYSSALTDISGFLTPREICELFNGEASETTLELVSNFISIFYKKIALRMNTKQRIVSFFILMGQLSAKDFCKQIDLNTINNEFCTGTDEYSTSLRACLLKRNPDLATETRQKYLDKKKQQIKAALKISYYPLDMRTDVIELNKVFENIEKEQTLAPLLEIADEFKSKYKESLKNMSSNFVANYEVLIEKESFISNVLGRIKSAGTTLPEGIEDSLKTIPLLVSKHEKQIFPEIVPALFLTRRNVNGTYPTNKYEIKKTFSTYHPALDGYKNFIKSLLSLDAADISINKDKLPYSSQIIAPYYTKVLSHEYWNLNRTANNLLKTEQDMLSKGDFIWTSGFTGDTPDTKVTKNAKIHNFNISVNSSAAAGILQQPYEDYIKNITGNNDKIFLKNKDLTFESYVASTYNELANICTNSIFAKKISVGPASNNDSGKMSGIELMQLSPEQRAACIEGLDLNFDLINFDNIARQIANINILGFNPNLNDEDEGREKFFNNLMIFKSQILDFVIKSIFVFSEFNFEENEIDDTMVDFVYLEFFRGLLEKDSELKEESDEFLNLDTQAQTTFIEDIRWSEFKGIKSVNISATLPQGGDQSKFDDMIVDITGAKNMAPIPGNPSDVAKQISLTYNVANTLRYFGSGKNEGSFCEAIRTLIRKEISNMSKALKDIIYTDLQKQSKIFNLEDRFIEKKLNILSIAEQKTRGFTNMQGDWIDSTIRKMIGEVMSYDHPYFETTKRGDTYAEERLAFAIQSQMGGESFFFTRFSNSTGFFPERGQKTVDIEVISCFFDKSWEKSEAVPDSKSLSLSGFNSYKIDEEAIANKIFKLDPTKKHYLAVHTDADFRKFTQQDVIGYSKRSAAGGLIGPGALGLYDALQFSGPNTTTANLTSENVIHILFNNAYWVKQGSKEGDPSRIASGTRALQNRSPYLVVEIENYFNMTIAYQWAGYNTPLTGWLKQNPALQTKNGLGRPHYELMLEILDAARKYVNKNKGKGGGSPFVEFLPGGQSQLVGMKMVDPPALTKTRTELGYTQQEYDAVKKGGYSYLYEPPSAGPYNKDHTGFRRFSTRNYPFSALSQLFQRTKWLIDDSKHGTIQQKSPLVDSQMTNRSLIQEKYVKNSYILDIIKNAKQRITPDSVALIDDWRYRWVNYKTSPVAKFKVNIDNYSAFKTNFKKEHGRDATDDDYLNICLKPKIIEEFKKQPVIPKELYKSTFPLKGMISHVACNLNNYIEYINNVEPKLGLESMPKRIVTVRSLDDFSLFNNNLLTDPRKVGIPIIPGLSGAGIVSGAGLSASQIQGIASANANLSALDIIMMSKTFSFAIYFIKTAIKQYLSIMEQQDMNLKISKSMADAIGTVVRNIYTASQSISASANKLGSIFGADTQGKGIPSQSELMSQFRGMKLLFNPPVFPFAIGNAFWLWPSSFPQWIAYLILEPVLIAIEMSEDAGLLEQLRAALFADDKNNSLSAPKENLEKAQKLAEDNAAKSNPIQKTKDGETFQETLGGEYLLPDGREYVGKYHTHADGTVMTDEAHKCGSSIILTPVYKRDDLE